MGAAAKQVATQAAFRALADPTRRAILHHLSTGDMTIGEVAANFDMTRAAVKKHLIILEEGDLVRVTPRAGNASTVSTRMASDRPPTG